MKVIDVEEHPQVTRASERYALWDGIRVKCPHNQLRACRAVKLVPRGVPPTEFVLQRCWPDFCPRIVEDE